MGRAMMFYHYDRTAPAVAPWPIRFESQAPGAWDSDTCPALRARKHTRRWWRVYKGDPRDGIVLGVGITMKEAVEAAVNKWNPYQGD